MPRPKKDPHRAKPTHKNRKWFRNRIGRDYKNSTKYRLQGRREKNKAMRAAKRARRSARRAARRA